MEKVYLIKVPSMSKKQAQEKSEDSSVDDKEWTKIVHETRVYAEEQFDKQIIYIYLRGD